MPPRTTLKTSDLAPAQPNQSVLAAVEVLMALSLESQSLGSHELARRLGWNVMRCNRILKTLAHAGLARRTAKGRYIAGSGLAVLSAQAIHASPLVRAARKAVDSAHLPHGLALGVLWQDKVCYLFHRPAHHTAPLQLGTHPPFDASRSSIGQLLRALRGDRAPGMATIRRLGFAHTVQDAARKEGSLAVPVGDTGSALAATDVATPAVARSLLPTLRRLADAIAREAGE